MACLFILYQNLIPHLHDFKNDVCSCCTKKELVLGACSSLRPRKGLIGGRAGKQDVARTHQRLLPGDSFGFCQEQVTLSESWTGTRANGLVQVFSAWSSLAASWWGWGVGRCFVKGRQINTPFHAFPFKQVKCREQKNEHSKPNSELIVKWIHQMVNGFLFSWK